MSSTTHYKGAHEGVSLDFIWVAWPTHEFMAYDMIGFTELNLMLFDRTRSEASNGTRSLRMIPQ